ncbi:PPOX class probable F420-dependent enzyme [Ferrithrix thermotolerans DSM 19514]|uniref:PPOX class probable F420-dependent enzyme n=2 Tax=Ferrithrix TaxID=643949 RepID=A0A1M4VGP5_9ACTN|nr:PPOX class probable F420-dependent enzyme [Ferrithrix thermotolerans DSM 19514]
MDPKITEFAKGKNFAAFTTIFPSGFPQTSIMWIDADDDHLLINTEIHRAKYANVQKNPKVSVVIWDNANPYSYIEVRGEVVGTVLGEEALDHINKVSEKYTGGPYSNPIQSERVILKILPERIRANG